MQTLIGVFSDKFNAEAALDDLKLLDYSPDDISIVMKNNVRMHQHKDKGSKGGMAVSGVTSGVTAGGVFGGLAGLLIGIGAITIPGVGALLVAGPLAAALGLTGIAATTVSGVATGLIAGGLVGLLLGLGIPEKTAKVYEERIKHGAILLAVPIDSRYQAEKIKLIFDQYNADQIKTVGK